FFQVSDHAIFQNIIQQGLLKLGELLLYFFFVYRIHESACGNVLLRANYFYLLISAPFSVILPGGCWCRYLQSRRAALSGNSVRCLFLCASGSPVCAA